MSDTDHELTFLLSLDGQEFRLIEGYTIKIEARTIAATGHDRRDRDPVSIARGRREAAIGEEP